MLRIPFHEHVSLWRWFHTAYHCAKIAIENMLSLAKLERREGTRSRSSWQMASSILFWASPSSAESGTSKTSSPFLCCHGISSRRREPKSFVTESKAVISSSAIQRWFCVHAWRCGIDRPCVDWKRLERIDLYHLQRLQRHMELFEQWNTSKQGLVCNSKVLILARRLILFLQGCT